MITTFVGKLPTSDPHKSQRRLVIAKARDPFGQSEPSYQIQHGRGHKSMNYLVQIHLSIKTELIRQCHR